MKKHISIILSLILALTLLGGCSNSSPSSTGSASSEAPPPSTTEPSAAASEPAPTTASPETEMADTAAHPNCKGNVTEYPWADAFASQDPAQFEAIFHESISQAAGTTPGVTFGAKTVSAIFGWASQFYEYCDFTHQAKAGNRTFLEWELMTNNNMYMTGMTIITKDSDGKVISAINAHRNLMEVTIFLDHFFQGPEGIGALYTVHTAALEQYGLEPKYVRKPDGTIKGQGVDDVYIDAFASASAQEFKKLLANDVTLTGGYIVEPMSGADDIAQTMAAVSGYYEHCVFTVQASHENRTYIQYEGRLLNQQMVPDGFIVLVRNDQGEITEIMDHPMPVTVCTMLSTYLREATAGTVSDKYFYRDTLFAEAVEKYGLDKVYGESTNMYIAP